MAPAIYRIAAEANGTGDGSTLPSRYIQSPATTALHSGNIFWQGELLVRSLRSIVVDRRYQVFGMMRFRDMAVPWIVVLGKVSP